jgi:hypothetical protein
MSSTTTPGSANVSSVTYVREISACRPAYRDRSTDHCSYPSLDPDAADHVPDVPDGRQVGPSCVT